MISAWTTLGYVATFLMGSTLGLMGSGGSILTLPILLYFFHMKASEATLHSLLLVGVTAFWGFVLAYRRKEVDVEKALLFFVPGMLGVAVSRKFILTAIPENYRDSIVLGLFLMLMVLAAIKMLGSKAKDPSPRSAKITWVVFALGGFLLGSVSGLLGAGGGFLIIPVLVLWVGLSMPVAIGTSLLMIFLNAFSAFLLEVSQWQNIQSQLLLSLVVMSALGMLFGIQMKKRINPELLKKNFAYFVLLVALGVFLKEFF